MSKKICLITGANSGIGKEAAILIAQQGYHIIMACRNPKKGQKALTEVKQLSKSEAVELRIVDMSLQSSIKNLAAELHRDFTKIDVVIHNAAIFDISQKQAIATKEGIESVWATNHVGVVLFDKLMLDLVKKSDNGRIIIISSKGLLAKPFLKVNLTDPEFKHRKFNTTDAYYQSKTAQMIYTLWLSEQLKNTNITVNAIRVPAVRVDISKYPNLPNFLKKLYKFKSQFSLSPTKMAETYQYLATSEKLNNVTGKYFDEKNQEVKFTKYQQNKEAIAQVIDLTMTYIH